MAKILFVRSFWYESLAVMQLSAVLKGAGHKVHLYMHSGNDKRLINKVKELDPDIVGFSIMTGQHLWAIQAAALLKNIKNENRPIIILGGHHPTFAPEIINGDGIDIVCRGEGEGALLDLMNAVDGSKDICDIPNLWVKKGREVIKNELRPLIENLDSLPFPDRDIFYQISYFRDNPNKMIMASRGCQFNCSFCFNEKYRQLYKSVGSKVRRRKADSVIEEIKLLKSNYARTRIIRFHDDVFTQEKEWLFTFLESYVKEVKLPFMCYIRAGVDGEEVIRGLAEAGCVGVAFGLETGNEKIRKTLLKKNIPSEVFYNTVRLLKKYKIPFLANTILFLPGSSLQNVWETVEMSQKLKPKHVLANIFQPLPGTTISEELLRNNVIRKDYVNRIENIYSFPGIENKDSGYEKNIFYFFYVLVKIPWLTPLVRILIKLKPNILFVLIYKITAGADYWFWYRLSFRRFFVEAYRHRHFRG